MPELHVPEVQDPDRFLPQPILHHRPESRPAGGDKVEIWHGEAEGWVRMHVFVLDVLDGLESGLDLPGIVAAMPDRPEAQVVGAAAKERLARRTIWHFAKRGFIELELPAPPAVFHDRFQRIEELGRGGLGIAHLCRDLEAEGRRVVVKHAWGVKRPIQAAQRTIAREIEAHRRLDHPAIPALVASFQRDGLLHLAREHVDGAPLEALGVEARPAEDRIGLLAQIADVLGHVHARGGLLLDLSPDNVLCTHGTCRLIDLGSARFPGSTRLELSSSVGTPGYAAPEARTGQPRGQRWASPASDVHGLGRLAVFLATGRRPSRHWGLEALVEAARSAGASQVEVQLVRRACPTPADQRARLPELVELLSAARG